LPAGRHEQFSPQQANQPVGPTAHHVWEDLP